MKKSTFAIIFGWLTILYGGFLIPVEMAGFVNLAIGLLLGMFAIVAELREGK